MEFSNINLTRRSFLTYLGLGTASLATLPVALGTQPQAAAAECNDSLKSGANPVSAKFTPIQPMQADKLVLPPGFTYEVVAAYGDRINEKGDTFGFNAASPCYFSLNDAVAQGILWVSHESTHSIWVEGGKQSGHYSADQVHKLLYNLGGSILEVAKDQSGVWQMVCNSSYARRVTGLDRFELTGPARGAKAVGQGIIVQGTLANGAAGKTLWDTVLSGEHFFADICRDAGLDATHYGWIVEVDPLDSSFSLKKHSALGRLHHGGVAMGLSGDNRVVVYTGDDTSNGCIFKYISQGKFDREKGKANSELLTEGTLYAADLENGAWIALDIDEIKDRLYDYQFKLPATLSRTREGLQEMYREAADVYVYPQEAALVLGATPVGRPAHMKIHPSDHSLFIAQASDPGQGSLHGQIVRLMEKNGDLGAASFEFEIIGAGGSQVGFSSPGRLSFDSQANLWIQSGIPSRKIGKGAWAAFQNNGLYLAGKTYPIPGPVPQFASAPMEAEFSGSWLTSEESTLFLTVQHPGEQTAAAVHLTSRWPNRPGDSMPRPALVAVRSL